MASYVVDIPPVLVVLEASSPSRSVSQNTSHHICNRPTFQIPSSGFLLIQIYLLKFQGFTYVEYDYSVPFCWYKIHLKCWY